jgi:hypothetical protein
VDRLKAVVSPAWQGDIDDEIPTVRSSAALTNSNRWAIAPMEHD